MKGLGLIALAAALVFVSTASAQNVTGSLVGTVVDQSGAAVPDAMCTLVNRATNVNLVATTALDGRFNFPIVPPGTYTLNIRLEGMKGISMSDIAVSAQEVRSLGRITMEVGVVTETISVTAEATPVQTSSSERAGLVSGEQINDIAIRGRDFLALVGMVPGVIDTSSGGREVVDPLQGSGSVTVMGNSGGMKNMTLDGMMTMDVGNNTGQIFQSNMDSIAEVKVLTSNFQAEYGRNAANINVITKTGTQDFHGGAYTYYRHESLNANNFFNNRSGVQRPVYRYRITGYTIGGPIYIPGKFNSNRDKLFFFFSQDLTGTKTNWGTFLSWMPTELERKGDFSNSRDVNGQIIPIKDPTTGQQFADNMIPSTRLNKYGQAIMSILPAPNYTDPNPGNQYRYNYRTSLSTGYPRRQEVLRADYNISPTLRFYYRLINYTDEKTLPLGNWMVGNQNFPLYNGVASIPGRGHVWSLTQTFTPTLINDLTVGVNRGNVLAWAADQSEVSRSRMGNIPQWFTHERNSQIEPDTMPDVLFGSVPAAPANIQKNGIPYRNINRNLSIVDNLSKVWGKHMFKFGVMAEKIWKGDPNSNPTNIYGTFNFSRDINNPFDTGHSYANALVGVFQSYSEDNHRDRGDTQEWSYEWYLQDNWRVTSRLTLDIGLRMSWWTPGTESAGKQYSMVLANYDQSKMPAMYVPAIDPSGRRVAQDPRTGAYAPAPLIGLFVPNSGDPFYGIAEGGTQGLSKSIKELRNPGWAPRFGFAYDVFGDGKTAIRGGFGIFKDRSAINQFMSGFRNPPNFYTVRAYYGNLDTFMQTGGTIGPTSPDAQAGRYKQTSVMKYSFGIQQQVFGAVIDASYVGSLSRHLTGGNVDANSIPMYARFDPANQDPTRPGKPLPDIFLKPYYGYDRLNTGLYANSSNYNSLQVSANRRLSNGLQFGMAFTFSKSLGYNGSNPYFTAREWNYGPINDRSKVFKANYIYYIPNLGRRLGSRPLGWVVDNWSLSGMVTFMSGAPFTPTFTTVDGEDTTGSALGARITVVGDPKLPKSEKTFYRNFNTDAFARTPKGSFGNAGNGILRGPGQNNWDMSLTKRVPLFSEARYLQFRWETFNTFNHTQFTGLNSTAKFDLAGNQIDSTFGQFTSAANPRVMQLSLRVVF